MVNTQARTHHRARRSHGRGGRRRIFSLAFWTAPSVVGVVRATQIRIAPEVGGQLAAIKVHKGDSVRAGDVVAELSALELSAAVVQARATLAAAQGQPRPRLCRCARRRDRRARGRDRQGEVAAHLCTIAARSHGLPGAQRYRHAAGR